MAVFDLGFDIPYMVMITSQDVPGDLERLRSVHRLKSVLVEDHFTHHDVTFTIFKNSQQFFRIQTVDLSDLEPRRIHTVHACVVEVIAKGQNKVSSHLLRYFTHFLSSNLLHSRDIGRVGDSTPVSYSQELNRSPVFCKGTEDISSSESEELKFTLMNLRNNQETTLTVNPLQIMKGSRIAVGHRDGSN